NSNVVTLSLHDALPICSRSRAPWIPGNDGSTSIMLPTAQRGRGKPLNVSLPPLLRQVAMISVNDEAALDGFRPPQREGPGAVCADRKSTRLNSSHVKIS